FGGHSYLKPLETGTCRWFFSNSLSIPDYHSGLLSETSSMLQITRFLDDLERRYPLEKSRPAAGQPLPSTPDPFADHDLSRRNTLGPSSHDPPDLPDAGRRRRDRLRPGAPGAVNSAVGLRGAVLHRPADIAEVVVSAGDPGPMTATEAPARGDRSGPLGLRTTADRKDRLLEGRSSGLVLADPSTGPLGGRRVGAGIIPDTAPSKSLAAYAVAFRAAGLDLLTSFRANPNTVRQVITTD